MVLRLAEAKAHSVTAHCPDGLIIGSDQAVECKGTVLGKPENFDNAKAQLQQMSGETLTFHTGLCLLNTRSQNFESDVIDFNVTFRDLSEQEIDRYLKLEKPYNCAGSFKSEQLGISLLKTMHGDDPTALIGLPLIRLSEMLRKQGINIP